MNTVSRLYCQAVFFENVLMFLQVNVAGSSFMVQAAVEQMQGHSLKENCSVVNLSSISAHQTQPNRQVEQKKTSTNFPRWTYAASKGAINILTKNMALDLAKYRIRVNSVSPGWIWSPEVAKVIFKTTLFISNNPCFNTKAAANGGRDHWEPTWGKFHISCRFLQHIIDSYL